MQPLHRTCALVGLVYVCSAPVAAAPGAGAADQQADAPALQRAAPEFSIRFGGRQKFRQLFQPAKPPASVPAGREQPGQRSKPRVTCGMVLIPADPSIDPKIGIRRRGQTNTESTIRAVQPPMCWPG